MKKYDLTLATLDVEPAYVASVEVEADSRKQAVRLALGMDFDDLEWTDAAGNETPWDEIGSDHVVVAED